MTPTIVGDNDHAMPAELATESCVVAIVTFPITAGTVNTIPLVSLKDNTMGGAALTAAIVLVKVVKEELV